MVTRKRGFKSTPNEIQDSMKIIVGNKTNSRVKDFGDENSEGDNKNIEEKTGYIVSIEKDKINGTGWTVQCKDGTYKCSCASNLYEIPKSKEKGGVLYPTEKVQCKIKVNPVLRVNTITEISGSKKKKKKLDINKWTHKDQDTTVIASLKSAISISDGAITFNYNDKSKVTIDKTGVNIKGGINADNLNIDGKSLDSYIPDSNVNTNEIPTDGNDNIETTGNDSTSEITLRNMELMISSKERVVGNILDQTRTPRNDQKVPMLTDANFDELNVYNDGVITVRARVQEGKRTINHTEKWIPQREKNIFPVTISDTCDYCEILGNSNIIFLDYCPSCGRWNTLSQTRDKIICNSCSATFCHACGHNEDNNGKNLIKYEENYIETYVGFCDYCHDILPDGKTKQYADYCPECGQLQTLNVIEGQTQYGVTNFLQCSSCDTVYCTNCGTKQSGYVQENFQDKEISYEDYIKEMKKLRFIKES